MKKRKLTQEQIEARDARKARMRKMAEEIAALTDEGRSEIAARCPGLASLSGRGLSPHNICLLIMQRPNVTLVGGFKQWLEHGRVVRKGEHGMAIWVPIGIKDDDGQITERTGFVGGTVFDISQTDPLEPKQ